MERKLKNLWNLPLNSIQSMHHTDHSFPFQKSAHEWRATITDILEQITIVNDGFGNRMQTDFSKAFDKVNHYLLLLNFDKMGCSKCMSIWIKSYLSRITQNVKFNNSTSITIITSSGVPYSSSVILNLFFLNFLLMIYQQL